MHVVTENTRRPTPVPAPARIHPHVPARKTPGPRLGHRFVEPGMVVVRSSARAGALRRPAEPVNTDGVPAEGNGEK